MTILSVFDTEKASNEGAELHLTNPATGDLAYADKAEKKPLTIRLLGPDSDIYTRHLQDAARKVRKANKLKISDDIDFEKAKREAAELYAKMTLGWSNIPDDSGKSDLPFSYGNAVKLYLTYKDIRIQVGDFIADKANFIKG